MLAESDSQSTDFSSYRAIFFAEKGFKMPFP
ncbi:hypothetical protein NEOC95_001062 [Neochlamydia sp. AcF95]|nr:hypothetical protein [Neochlamydia sp. AcF95]